MKPFKLACAACLVCLLAACAEQPARPTPPSASVTMEVPPPVPQVAPLPPPPPPQDDWSRLRASFALDDCNLNPRTESLARRFTHDPRRFETQLHDALPLLLYVQDAAQRAGIPGEFVLLPMIESGYDPAEPGRHGDPAGMWQIMPETARTMGLAVRHGYDGRLDPAASTRAVMTTLKDYHQDLHDWRLVDMAFNAGEYKVLGLMDRRGQPPAEEPLHLPVGDITRNHLAKLLAMACIMREPKRFNVDLPQPDSDRKLTLVQLPEAVDLSAAAKFARMPPGQLRELNPGYRGKSMPADAPHHLLLPQVNADELLAAVAANGADVLARNAPDGGEHSAARTSVSKSHHLLAQRVGTRHKVLRGESLSEIARHYHLDAQALRIWNSLASGDIHPGQTLRLSAPE